MCIFAVINMKRVKEAKSRQIQTIMSCVAILLVIFFILAVVFAIIHPEGFDPIKYWGFYYWMYKLFGAHLYLPFFLSIFFTLAIFFVFFVGIFAAIKMNHKSSNLKIRYLWYTLGVISIVVITFLNIKTVAQDLSYIQKGEYCEKEIDLHQLKRRKSSGRGHSIYYDLERLRLNVYQYRDLKAKKENFVLTLVNFDKCIQRSKQHSNLPPLTAEDKQIIIETWEMLDEKNFAQQIQRLGLEFKIKVNVCYLPASRRVLKYEI